MWAGFGGGRTLSRGPEVSRRPVFLGARFFAGVVVLSGEEGDLTVGLQHGFIWFNAGPGSVMVIVTDMSKDKAVNLSAAKDLTTQLADNLPD